MFNTFDIILAIVLVAFLAFITLVFQPVERDLEDLPYAYHCVIPDPDPNLPCRVQMRRDVYLENK